MSYEVLARKWRPLRFEDVIGQSHITRTLARAVETDRVSHAYLFSGPRGCGKTSTARILARVINCEKQKKGDPCNECDSCKAVIAGRHLDVMEIDGASHTGVSEVRDLQESIGYTPSQSGSKIYIIDEVHMLSTHADNALLKTLEEPPPHVYFIFATTEPKKIPDTIKSRCQRHHFKRLEISEIADRLEGICKSEKVKFDADALRLLARKADGSMRDGTSLLDQCITSSQGKLDTPAVRGILGIIDQEKIFAFVGAIASGDAGAVLRLLDECVTEGLDVQELCSAMLEGYRDLMLLAAPGDLSDLLFLTKDEVDHLRPHLSRYELPDLVTIVERLSNATPRLKAASDPRILLETLLVDLTLLDRQTDIRTLISRLEGGAGESGVRTQDAGKRRRERGPEKSSASLTDAEAVAPPMAARRSNRGPDADEAKEPEKPRHETAPETLDAEELSRLWGGFITFVRQKKVSLGVCLLSGKIYSFDGKRLILRFMKSFSLQKEQVAKESNASHLEAMFKKYFGREVELVCFLEGEEKAVALEEKARVQKTPKERFRDVSEENKPVVQKLMSEFDGEIVRYNR